MKTVAPRIWKSWTIVSEPTSTHGQIRKDENGRKWEWTGKIQNISIKPV